MPQDSLLVPTVKKITAATFVQRVKEEIHRDRDVDQDAILREMCSALEWYKTHRFWFNSDSFTFLTVAGQLEYGREGSAGVTAGYGYPEDMVRLDNLRITINSSTYDMSRINVDWIRKHDTNTSYTGYPDHYAIHNQKILLYPRPSTADWVVSGDYVKDLGTPTYVYTSGDWVLKDEDGGTTGLTWTSTMLQEAEELIRQRTKAMLYANIIIDTERAQVCKMLEEEALAHLEARSDWFDAQGPVQPWY